MCLELNLLNCYSIYIIIFKTSYDFNYKKIMDILSFEIQDKRLFQNFVLSIQEYTVLGVIVMWNPLHSSTLILINSFLNIVMISDLHQFLPQ